MNRSTPLAAVFAAVCTVAAEAAVSAAHLRGVAFFALDDALLELLPGLAAPAP